MNFFKRIFHDKDLKKKLYTAVFAVLACWFVFRFVMVAIESRMVVFNPFRDANKNGTLVETIIADKKEGIIKFPIVVTDNRAYVSKRAHAKLRAGQKISGGGTIVFVSDSLDYDSGMYVVKTRGVQDGVNDVEIPCHGYFVPVYAVRDGMVFVEKSGVAESVPVSVSDQDSEFACVADGIKNGDVVILSRVLNNQKISK